MATENDLASAAIGELTPSFMHELNNLMGIALMASSILEEQIKDQTKDFDQKGTVTNEEMISFLSEMSEASQLVTLNLQQMASVVDAFKQVVLDHAKREIRSFNLKDYIHEIVFSLKPKLKKTPHSLRIECPDTLEMSSCPGALALVLINLILNSLIHAFKEDHAGQIHITAFVDEQDVVHLTYTDDGKGIPEENFPVLFDRFFSTRGNETAGLGLVTVKRMVEMHLQGKIIVTNPKIKGARFEMKLPRCLKA